nr:polymorphic toxin type 34 domain-containing protein [Escherichia coli]
MITGVWKYRGKSSDVLQELIDCGDISAKDAKSTQKAWNCRHSRQSNDKKR